MSTDRDTQLSKEEESDLPLHDHESELNFAENFEEEEAMAATPEKTQKSSREGESLALKMSLSLYRKLHNKAKEEGVSVEELASELLAEGLVLRAWEIMERKKTMKGSSSSASSGNNRHQNRSYNNRGNGNNNYSQKGRGRPGNPQFQNKNGKRQKFSHGDLNDNANFIEYVRSQEKKKW